MSTKINTSAKTITRSLFPAQTAKKKVGTFTFIDLFAGLGGFRIPLEELGGISVGFSEIDKTAIQAYVDNFDVS